MLFYTHAYHFKGVLNICMTDCTDIAAKPLTTESIFTLISQHDSQRPTDTIKLKMQGLDNKSIEEAERFAAYFNEYHTKNYKYKMINEL